MWYKINQKFGQIAIQDDDLICSILIISIRSVKTSWAATHQGSAH